MKRHNERSDMIERGEEGDLLGTIASTTAAACACLFLSTVSVSPHPNEDAVDAILKYLMAGSGLVAGFGCAVAGIVMSFAWIAANRNPLAANRLPKYALCLICLGVCASALMWLFGAYEFGIERRPSLLYLLS